MSVICLVLGGVVRVRLYVIYAHLCNHMLLRSGGDLGHSSVHRQRCGFWESGCRRLARKRPARRGSGAPSTDWLGAWGCLFRSHGLLDWSTLSLSGNKNTHQKLTLPALLGISKARRWSIFTNCSALSHCLPAPLRLAIEVYNVQRFSKCCVHIKFLKNYLNLSRTVFTSSK